MISENEKKAVEEVLNLSFAVLDDALTRVENGDLIERMAALYGRSRKTLISEGFTSEEAAQIVLAMGQRMQQASKS